jgi:hypothetical protein
MHPDILRQLAAEHTQDLITEAGQARAREARHTQRRRGKAKGFQVGSFRWPAGSRG